MKLQNVLVFGASGQIGRHLIRKLTNNNFIVTAYTRSIHQKGYILKTQANAGYLNIVEGNIFNEQKLRSLIKKTDICINLVGILFEKGKVNTFKNIHSKFPGLLAKICREYNVKQFIQLSALGIDDATDSNYAKSKLEGEKNIIKNFSNVTILRPSIVYSVDDNFTTNFMTLLSRIPVFPLYYKGNTKFMPIHCSDLTEIIYQVIKKNFLSIIIECIGPETISLKEILQRLLKIIKKKRIFISVPLPIAKISAKLLGLMPRPLLTKDQLILLKYDNISSGRYKTNFDVEIPSFHMFNQEIEKYGVMWREMGQFSLKDK